MKSIKYLVMLACVTFGLIMSASAQIYSNEVCFYQEVDNPTTIIVLKCENRNLLRIAPSYSEIKQNISTSIYYYENDVDWGFVHRNYPCEYDEKTSSSKYEVYKTHFAGGLGDWNGHCVEPPFMAYYAVSKDLSSYIQWRERDSDGEIYKKKYFVRISKEDILPKPKSINRDFLND